ncbi:hypothetical protein AVEN_146471-1 [Araneus ventricosus]|uniref:Uncharacterized protein n=1 Tax=Araneus ventricosus TaxID=182803 RepID=A0A4Y2K0U8_ARAVE|nr:hypothetical protein AVEN_146471-1 [Araneus ventricosus]
MFEPLPMNVQQTQYTMDLQWNRVSNAESSGHDAKTLPLGHRGPKMYTSCLQRLNGISIMEITNLRQKALKHDDRDDDEQSDIDIAVVPPETAEASDEEEGNNNILNHDNDDLPCDTASETEVHSKKKFESSESSCSRVKKLKKIKN